MSSNQILDPDFYRKHLLENILPFWFQHALDTAEGGIFTCISDNGVINSDTKYIWSQCRAIWTFAATYNHIDSSEKYLRAAETIADFVLRFGKDASGRYNYIVSRTGEQIKGPISVYSDFFAAYGFAELYRASHNSLYLKEALRVLRQVVARVREPDFQALAPYSRPEGIGFIHGVSMITLESVQEVALSAPDDSELCQWCISAAQIIMQRHVREEEGLLLEHLDQEGNPVDSPAGRAVNPGHAIESMWFVIHHALRQKNHAMVRKACEVIRWHLEKGWDKEWGGLFLGIDAKGGNPWWPHAEKKIWWPHTEAIYALHLASVITGEAWTRDWLERITDYTLKHFPNSKDGEWYQRLSREGQVIDKVIALPVKDPFHLPRMLIRITQLLEHGLDYITDSVNRPGFGIKQQDAIK